MPNRICWIATSEGPQCVPLLARVQLNLGDGGSPVRCVVHRSASSRSSLALLTHEASGYSLGELPISVARYGQKRASYKERAQQKMDTHVSRQGADYIRATLEAAPALVKPVKTEAA